MDGLVRAQILAGTKTSVSPEFRNLVKTGKDSGSDTFALRIASAEQQHAARGLQISNQGSHPFHRICRNQALLREYILQLFVVFVSEREIVRLLNDNATLLSFAHTSSTGAIHFAEEFVFRLSQIAAVGSVGFRCEPILLSVFGIEKRIGYFHVQALQSVPCDAFNGGQGCFARRSGQKIETHEGCGPSGKGTPQDSDAEPRKHESREIADALSTLGQFAQDDLSALAFAHELKPFVGLEHRTIRKAV